MRRSPDNQVFKRSLRWKMTFREFLFNDLLIKPLGNTIKKSNQGVAGHANFGIGIYPACSEHGAMNKVTTRGNGNLWRCLNCNIGVEIDDSIILGAR